MEQMEELQRRIQGALDRIGSGFGALEEQHAAAVAAAETAEKAAAEAAAAAQQAAEQAANQAPVVDEAALVELREELDDEKTANAQLTARNEQLHARVSEMEVKVAAIDKVDQIVAMEAELELLRNEANKPAAPSPEVEALRGEVDRLKSELEGAQNQAAMEKDDLLDQIEALQAQTVSADAGAAEDAGAGAESVAALQNENNDLRAQLEEALTALNAAQAGDSPEDVDSGISATLDARLEELDGELQSLRASNDQLRDANSALRSANAEGVGDAELINQALEAEIQGLRAARAADQAEVNAVIARLAPLLPGAPNLPEGETM